MKMDKKYVYATAIVTFALFVMESAVWRHIDSYVVVNICFFSRFLLTTVFCVAVIGVIFRGKWKSSAIVSRMAAYSMGIYILHHFIIELLLEINMVKTFMNVHIIVAPIAMLATVLTTSTVLTWLIRKIRSFTLLV